MSIKKRDWPVIFLIAFIMIILYLPQIGTAVQGNIGRLGAFQNFEVTKNLVAKKIILNGTTISASGSALAAAALPKTTYNNTTGRLAGTMQNDSTLFWSGNRSWRKPSGSGGGGTVTSIALTVPGIFGLSGSPVTTSGTFAITLASQPGNYVFAGPNGASGNPTFRALLAADIPAIPESGVTNLPADLAAKHSATAFTGYSSRHTGSGGTFPAFGRISSAFYNTTSTIQVRHDTYHNWSSSNPTLLVGEIGYETNTTKFKIGDGTTAYRSLPYQGLNRLANDWTFTEKTTPVSGDKILIEDSAAGYAKKFVQVSNLPAGSGLPSQSGNGGKYAYTNGTTASWHTVSGGGIQYILVQDRKAANTSPGNSIVGTQTRTLNTIVADNTGSAVLNGYSTLNIPSGTYIVCAWTPAYNNPMSTQATLQKMNAAFTGYSTFAIGNTSLCSAWSETTSIVHGYFSSSVAQRIKVRQYTNTAATGGLGAYSASLPTVFTTLELWKIQ